MDVDDRADRGVASGHRAHTGVGAVALVGGGDAVFEIGVVEVVVAPGVTGIADAAAGVCPTACRGARLAADSCVALAGSSRAEKCSEAA